MKSLIIIIFATLLTSCTQYQKNQIELNKAYELSDNDNSEEDLRQALKIYSSVIDQQVYAQKRMSSVYRILGDRSFAMEQYGYAAKYYSEALKITPTNIEIHYQLGLTYANLYESTTDSEQRAKFLESAEKEVAYSLSKYDDNPKYLATFSTIVGIYKDEPERALTYITKALSIEPTNIQYLFILARLQYQLENYSASINTYERIITLSPDSYNTRQHAEANIKQIREIR